MQKDGWKRAEISEWAIVTMITMMGDRGYWNWVRVEERMKGVLDEAALSSGLKLALGSSQPPCFPASISCKCRKSFLLYYGLFRRSVGTDAGGDTLTCSHVRVVDGRIHVDRTRC